MHCHVCNAEVGEGQRFCHECGESLTGVTDPTQPVDAIPAPDAPTASADETVDQAVGGEHPDDDGDDAGSTVDTADLPVTEPIPASELPDAPPPPPGATTVPIAAAPLDPPATSSGPSLFDADRWQTDEQEVQPAPDPAAVATGMIAAAPTDPPPPPGAEATTAMAATPGPYGTTGEVPHVAVGGRLYDHEGAYDDPSRFRFRPTVVFGFLTLLATLMVSVADITDVRTDRPVPGIDNQLRQLEDIGSNLAIAGLIGAVLMFLGGAVHCWGHRWAGGIAGGGGLALAGWAALALGLAEIPIDQAERITRDPTTPGPFVLTVTRDLGYWLLIAVAVLGLVTFVASLWAIGSGGRRGLNPWTAAVGALGAVIASVGPLITVGGADLSVNFGTSNLPVAFFAGRLAQLGLLMAAGVLGFLSVRVYGLGLAAGGFSVATWLWITSLLQVGDNPLGIAAGNLGTTDTTPHAVTSAGMVVVLVMLVAAGALAIAQSRR